MLIILEIQYDKWILIAGGQGTGVYGFYLRDVGELWTMTVICDDVPQDRVK